MTIEISDIHERVYSVRMQGRITAIWPLTSSSPAVSKPSDPKLPRPMETTAVVAGGVVYQVPCIRSTGIRGALRHAMFTAVTEKLVEQGDRTGWMADDVVLNVAGGVKGAGKTDGGKTHEIRLVEALRRRNPILSVMGAGTPFIGGSLYVSFAIPSDLSQATTVIPVVRADPVKRDPRILGVMQEDEAELYISRREHERARSALKGQKETLEKTLKGLKKGAEGHAELAEEIKALEERMEFHGVNAFADGVSLQHVMGGFQAIPQGTELDWEAELHWASPAEIGLFIAALEVFADEPFLGGNRARGCGRVALDLDRIAVKYRRRPVPDPEGAVPSRIAIDEGGRFVVSGPFLEKCQAIWRDLDVAGEGFDFRQDAVKADAIAGTALAEIDDIDDGAGDGDGDGRDD